MIYITGNFKYVKKNIKEKPLKFIIKNGIY